MTPVTRPTDVVVAVDGTSGSGKSSTARGVAQRLGLRYLDTGAMYRAVTWWMLRHGVDVADPAAVAARVGQPDIVVSTDPTDPHVLVDGTDVTREIRGPDVTSAVSAVSAVPDVRRRLVQLQRAVIDHGGAVVEGRDIGTVVAPNATVKVFLDADPRARAHRRTAELPEEHATDVDTTHLDLLRRDDLDSSRTVSPLVRADDAVVIDSTELGLEEVIETVLGLVRSATGGAG